jgi:hypothetical protein
MSRVWLYLQSCTQEHLTALLDKPALAPNVEAIELALKMEHPSKVLRKRKAPPKAASKKGRATKVTPTKKQRIRR